MKKRSRKIREMKILQSIVIFIILIFATVPILNKDTVLIDTEISKPVVNYSVDEVLEYRGEESVVIHENKPSFTEGDLKFTGERYSELDQLGRCGQAIALVTPNTMPTEKRGSIGMVKPSGWHTIKYDIVNGKYLYNRCHLIGYQLTGENANPKNLITCTRNMNISGMLQYENIVADYVKETGNSVLYRVTPIFQGDHLVASGVEIEAQSIEDDVISFHVYVYNVQEGIEIDYMTGESKLKS